MGAQQLILGIVDFSMQGNRFILSWTNNLCFELAIDLKYLKLDQ